MHAYGRDTLRPIRINLGVRWRILTGYGCHPERSRRICSLPSTRQQDTRSFDCAQDDTHNAALRSEIA
jgi:hypothetical protein